MLVLWCWRASVQDAPAAFKQQGTNLAGRDLEASGNGSGKAPCHRVAHAFALEIFLCWRNEGSTHWALGLCQVAEMLLSPIQFETWSSIYKSHLTIPLAKGDLTENDQKEGTEWFLTGWPVWPAEALGQLSQSYFSWKGLFCPGGEINRTSVHLGYILLTRDCSIWSCS